MNRQIFALSFGLGIALLEGQHAHAQNAACGPHDQIVTHLAAEFGESLQSIGLTTDNTVLEVFASSETGTWTITVTTAGGPTCLVAAGRAFQNLQDPLPNTDPEA